MPRRSQVKEETWFIRDSETEPSDKNALLASYLGGGVWSNLNVVRVDRIEIADSGWRATYRVKPPRRSTGNP